MLNRYCPTGVRISPNTSTSFEVNNYASTHQEVYLFASKVVFDIIPRRFWSLDDDYNEKQVKKDIKKFIKLKRYESFSVLKVMNGLKLNDLPWLKPLARSPHEMKKRQEILAEFILWLFDRYLVTLLRAHFYITESSDEPTQVKYFRHDVWKRITAPMISSLKTNMFAKVTSEEAWCVFNKRLWGASKIRLLPKRDNFRVLANLSKPATRVVSSSP